MIEIVVYGSGGFARETAWLVDSCPDHRTVGFIDDDETRHGRDMHGLPVVSLVEARERFEDARVVGAIGGPRAREAVTSRAAASGFGFATVIHPRVEMSRRIEVGEGTVICAGNILTTDIRLGRHVQINLDCTVGHDSVLEDFVTLAPGVHVSGFVHIGARAYVGTGAVLINGTPGSPLIVGEDAVIGAGACVTNSVEAGATVVGVPARPLGRP